MKLLILILAIIIFILLLCEYANAEINLELGYGQAYARTSSDEDYQGKGRWATDNTLNDDAFSIGLTGHVYEAKYLGLLLSAKYNWLGRVVGNRNKVCAPEGCQRGEVATTWTGTMTTWQKTHGGTFGVIGELKLGNLSIMPEGGWFYGVSKLQSIIRRDDGSWAGINKIENSISSFYYGAQMQFKTDYGNVYFGVRQYPKSGGELMFVNDMTVYEVGISIPVWK